MSWAIGQSSTSVDDFLAKTEHLRGQPGARLFAAAGAKDPELRYAMIERVLDDGDDASAIVDGEGILTVLLAAREQEPAGLGRTIARLIAAGADPDVPDSRRQRPPILQVLTMTVRDADAGPVYDALIDAVDLDAPFSYGRFDGTVREYVMASGGRDELQERVRARA